MRIQNTKFLALLSLVFMLSACNGFFEKDNTPTPAPLTFIQPEITPRHLWTTKTGSGPDKEFLKMGAALGENAVFTAGTDGVVTAIDQRTGRVNWQSSTHLVLSSGPGVGDGIVVVGSRRGDVAALREMDGRRLWQITIPGAVLSAPAVGHGTVVVKTIDGHLRGLSVSDGHELWSFHQVEPNLILRGSSKPLIRDNSAIVGFASGGLARINLYDGQAAWQKTIAVPQGAFAIQRMIDIDADPVVFEHHIYAATYQGSIASLDWASGQVLWSHDISSYTGMTTDDNTVYISDAKSYVWAFGANNGLVNWRQTQLEARNVSGPAALGNYVVVGDSQGYLHWLNKRDGHFAARVSVGSGIYAAPVVKNNVLYALTNNGYLVAYTLG